MIKALADRTLQCHPHAPCRVGIDLDVEVGVVESVLVVTYRIVGDIARLRIPSAPLDPERLWAHTCCELFVAQDDGDGYVEHNFSPNGQIARFEFSAYRVRRVTSSAAAASIACARETGALVLRARVPVDVASARIAITAVVEDEHGNLSYWALRHPEGRPDFHHRAGFALSLTLGAVPAIVDVPA